MALVNPYIFQVVGYQNSGKTTVVSTLIKELNKLGRQVAVIKHHGHGGRPELVETKDSVKHVGAGAKVAVVEGGGRLILQADQPSWNLADEIELIRFFQPDIILIEGHKKENYPKLLLLKEKKDLELFHFISNIKIVLAWEQTLQKQLESITSAPSFLINDLKGIAWTVHHIEEQIKRIHSQSKK